MPVDSINGIIHDFYPSISPDGQAMYFTKGNYIWVSNWNGSSWGTPAILGENINSGQRQIKATVTPDNQTLYFTSWRAGGYGTYDIWKSNWDDSCECWDEAAILPPPLSTEYMEWDVQLSYDGRKMYISSDRQFSWGDFDIWCSDWDDSAQDWGTPYNLGTTINTSSRDYSAYPSLAGNVLFFASWSRHGFWPPAWQDPPELFVAYNRNGAWDSLTILTSLNSEYWDESPALSWDGMSLYFASSRNNPDGWSDIYVSTRANNIEDDIETPQGSGHNLNIYPNPGNNAINFNLHPKAGSANIQLIIVNILGQKIVQMDIGNSLTTTWDCRDYLGKEVSSGCYFAICSAPGLRVAKRFQILK